MTKNTLLAIAMPVNNKHKDITSIVTGWVNLINTFFAKDDTVQLLLLDNGSTDGTIEILEQLKQQYPDTVKLVLMPKTNDNEALVNTYKEALKLNADYVFQVNADASLPPDEFHKIWERHQIGKLVIGFREGSAKVSFLLKLVIQLLFKVEIKDAAIPYRLIQSDYLKALIEQLPQPLPMSPNTYMAVLAKYSGMGLHNVPIEVNVKYETSETEACITDLFKRYFNIKRSARRIANLNRPV